ncbi:hypothetical protein [Qingshengfaniella alkalisoli]|nr:hypothetical protein [Qingshengfaniella alkalisoli]
MIRLVIWAMLFCGGLWAGAEYERIKQVDRCLDYGGSYDARGFCSGAN